MFTLVAQPSDVTRLLAHLQGIIPDSAISLLQDSLVRMTTSQANGGLAMIIVGTLLALWTLTGAMTTLMWALNIAFDRDESRGFVRQRLVALAMLLLIIIAAILAFALLVLGPQLQGWVGDAIDQRQAGHLDVVDRGVADPARGDAGRLRRRAVPRPVGLEVPPRAGVGGRPRDGRDLARRVRWVRVLREQLLVRTTSHGARSRP